MKERLAASAKRERPGILPLTEDEASDHLKRTLAGPNGKWSADTTSFGTVSSRHAPVGGSTSV